MEALASLAGFRCGANVRFAGHLEDGRTRFDYKMRAGVATKGDALELMRSVGLDV